MRAAPDSLAATAVVAAPVLPAGPFGPAVGGRKEVVVGTLGEVSDVLELLEAVGVTDQELEVLADGRIRVRWS